MKVFLLILFICLLPCCDMQQGNEVKGPAKLELEPTEAKLKVGEKVDFQIKAYDEKGESLKTDTKWSTSHGGSVVLCEMDSGEVAIEWSATGGNISNTGTYQADIMPGKYHVQAKAGNASDKVEVEILEKEEGYPGFTYLRTRSYSLGKQSYQVKEYRHNQTGMEFILVPAGSFMMGDAKGTDNQKPLHKVKCQEFLMGKYEVTQEQWLKIMKSNPAPFKGANKPVENVSWYKVKEFCKKTGLSLPSESQWEYACRAGTTTKYYWGNNPDSSYMRYSEKGMSRGESVLEVGSKKPNAFGLYDMLGNVSEWCEDMYQKNYKNHPSNGAPYLAKNVANRVLRGGDWNSMGSVCASAVRSWASPSTFMQGMGFRCVFNPE